MARLLIVALIALAAAACGSTGVGGGSNPTPSPTESTGLGFDVTATEKDHKVSMHPGQKLQLVLHGSDQLTYQEVTSSDRSILEPTVHPGATAARGVTLAAFQAKKTGIAEVTAVGLPVCPSGQACPMYAILYRLEVSVTPTTP